MAIQCGLCRLSFSRQWCLARHMRSVHEREIYQCLQCPQVFNRIDTLKRHEQQQHLNTAARCPSCAQLFRKGDLSTREAKCASVTSTEKSDISFYERPQDKRQEESLAYNAHVDPIAPGAIALESISIFNADNATLEMDIFGNALSQTSTNTGSISAYELLGGTSTGSQTTPDIGFARIPGAGAVHYTCVRIPTGNEPCSAKTAENDSVPVASVHFTSVAGTPDMPIPDPVELERGVFGWMMPLGIFW